MRQLVLLTLLPALIGGCSENGEPAHLSQTTWRFVLIDGSQPGSSDAGLTFDRGNIGVQVGCNRMGGPWRVDSNRLVAGPLAQTEMACSDPAWSQEAAVGALLVATPRMNLTGDRMVLQSSGHTAELVRVDKDGPKRGG